jgi:hypothetical protein
MPLAIAKLQNPILSVEDWFRLAPPARGKTQWVDAKSAKTCAEVWLQHVADGGPPEVLALLRTHRALATAVLERAEPEARIAFDARAGNTRNADLAIVARDQHGPIAVTVEAKAGETFGETVADALVDGLESKVATPTSAKLARIEDLARALLPPRPRGMPKIGPMRYQLLTAVAGTLAHATQLKATRAVMIVHQFDTARTTAAMHVESMSDLQAFLRRLAGDEDLVIQDGVLLGPFLVPGRPLFMEPAELYVGTVTRTT